MIGLLVDGAPVAFPLNVLQWHENVNIDIGYEQLAVTYCPLTGTALTFDRSVVDGAELGVSGLLFRNNLVTRSAAPPSAPGPCSCSSRGT